MLKWLEERLPRKFEVFLERFRRGPLTTPDELSAFIRTRSAYVSQTALYGYLKTRMGTRFRSMFEDDVFSRSIRGSAEKLFASCAADFTIYCVALLNAEDRDDSGRAAGLAGDLFRDALETGLAERDSNIDLEALIRSFDSRAAGTDWTAMAQADSAFAGSIEDLIRFAPVIDEFKELDREIVTNSIRFRWRDIREQARKRVRADHFIYIAGESGA